MPLSAEWSPLIREWVEKENDCYGVYYLGNDSGDVLFIGVGHILTNLKSHILGSESFENATRYCVEYAGNQVQARRLHESAIKEYVSLNGSVPIYNRGIGTRHPRAQKRAA